MDRGRALGRDIAGGSAGPVWAVPAHVASQMDQVKRCARYFMQYGLRAGAPTGGLRGQEIGTFITLLENVAGGKEPGRLGARWSRRSCRLVPEEYIDQPPGRIDGYQEKKRPIPVSCFPGCGQRPAPS